MAYLCESNLEKANDGSSAVDEGGCTERIGSPEDYDPSAE